MNSPTSTPAKELSIRDRIERSIASLLFGLPPGIKVMLSGGKPVVRDGLTLHPELQLMLALRTLAAGGDAGLAMRTPAQARRHMRREAVLYQGPALEIGEVRELRLESGATTLSARHYAPVAVPGGAPKPLCVFFHGGGFVIGDLDTHDAPCRFLCQHADVHVLSVDYRVAPEAKFPTAVLDALEGFRFAVKHAAELGADPSRIGVAGDSAGGNLSAVVAQLTRDAKERTPDFAVLIYPATDRKTPYPSKSLFANGFLLTQGDMDFFDDQYFGADEATRTDPRLSPLLHSQLAGLCPSVVITAGFDPLRDEGEAYARALEQAGNKVSLRREAELIHGFINMQGVSPACRAALMRIADDVRTASRA
jgi:acetyl esterase